MTVRTFLQVDPMTWLVKGSIQRVHINSAAAILTLKGSTPEIKFTVSKCQYPSYYAFIGKYVTENADAPVSVTEKEERFKM